MDGFNFVLHLYLMAQAPFLWTGARLANECLLRRPGWQECLAGLPSVGPEAFIPLSCALAGAPVGYFHASHSAALLVYKHQSTEAEAPALTLSY